MFKLTKLLFLREKPPSPEADTVIQTLRELSASNPAVTRWMLEPTLAGVMNGGNFIWHLQFADEAAYRALLNDAAWREKVVPLFDGPIKRCESAAYEGGVSGVRSPGLARGVYRTLILSASVRADEERIKRFETELAGMPTYIAAIRNWQLSRVSAAEGSRPWTHVWEQEYDDLAGLTGPYMNHPYHWGLVDRWFNPDCSQWIVDKVLCHTYCEFKAPVIRPAA
jgi:Stress responsive A/B Barrel Domain